MKMPVDVSTPFFKENDREMYNNGQQVRSAEDECSEQLLAKIAQSVPGIVAVYNVRTGQYLYINQAIQSILGYAPQAFLQGGMSFALSIVHPDDLARISHENTRAIEAVKQGAKQKRVAFEYRMRHQDGSWRWLHTDGSAFSYSHDGSVESVLNISIDITEQKRTEELLRMRLAAEPSLLELVLQSSGDAIISQSTDGIVRLWNSGAEKIFGYRAEEALGQATSFLIPSPRVDEESALLQRVLQGEHIDHFDTKRMRKDGRVIDVSLSISPIKNEYGEIIGVVKTARDITERKRYEAQLKQQEKRKDEFIAILAHELRNPLSPISSAVEILKLASPTSPQGEWALDVIHRQLSHMTRLIDDLLDISRIASNKLKLKKEKVALQDFVHAAIETVDSRIKEGGHALIVEMPSEQLFVSGDSVRLSQAISNILTNAAKYTPPGGTIKLSAMRKDEAIIMQIEDNGIGITAEFLPRIFDMFVQGKETPITSRGLGIGLTLVKKLIELHGGRIDAFSAGEGKGSVFTITLPEMKQQSLNLGGMGGGTEAQASELRILIADDNTDALTTLEMVLRLQGHTTAIAHDGLEAIQAAEEFRPDVVLLDIGMPNMNGYEAAKIVRSQSWGQAVALVAITGWGQDTDKKRAIEAGFDHHLTKPVDIKALGKLLIGVQRKVLRR